MRADPDFLIVLDEAYAKFLDLGLKTLLHFHPGARVFLYDLSPEPSDLLQAMTAQHKNVCYTHWPESKWLKNPWIDSLGFTDFNHNYNIPDRLKHLSRVVRYKLSGKKKEGWGELDKKEYVRKKRHFMNLCSQRTVICRDCLERAGNNLVFIDADAFVWGRLDPVFKKDFDVALTLRRLNDIKIGPVPGIRCEMPIPYKVINAGVLYFKNNDRSLSFVDLWIDKVLSIRDFAPDQTALAQLALDADAHAFEDYEKGLLILRDDCSIAIKLLPCEPYNNFYIGDDLIFDNGGMGTHIAHFKGYLHRDGYYSALKAIVEKHLEASGVSTWEAV